MQTLKKDYRRVVKIKKRMDSLVAGSKAKKIKDLPEAIKEQLAELDAKMAPSVRRLTRAIIANDARIKQLSNDSHNLRYRERRDARPPQYAFSGFKYGRRRKTENKPTFTKTGRTIEFSQ